MSVVCGLCGADILPNEASVRDEALVGEEGDLVHMCCLAELEDGLAFDRELGDS